MGYPMSYDRVVHRNGLCGSYASGLPERRMIAGDLRRLEADQLDINHLKRYAYFAGITVDQARLVLTAFFWPNLFSSLPSKVMEDLEPPNVPKDSYDSWGY